MDQLGLIPALPVRTLVTNMSNSVPTLYVSEPVHVAKHCNASVYFNDWNLSTPGSEGLFLANYPQDG